MVIIDKSGVHHLEVQCCDCPNAMSLGIQMFRHGFFPTSFNKPKTMFTFRALNDFLLDNLKCSTLMMNYYSKLCNAISPPSKEHYIDKVHGKDQYRELMRAAQQWRQLKTMKWHGFGHCSDNPNAGDLALFCPAWDESLDDWKYTWSFIMDRNFKAKHLHPIKSFDEVWLSNGLGFMVGKDSYKKHLAEAADTMEKLSCNNHWAVNQANAAQHNLKSTGIRRVAYFQKGERQAKHAI
ncbi:hypothetical protein BDR05DRAFT_976639 [Suillus weaverae]|nr:hypothetical protein BDR05DRAFT_976639 [Suillus weaverae]